MGGMRTACLIECMFVVAAVSGCAQRVPDVVCLGPYEYKVQLGQGGWYVLRWESFPAQTGSNKAGVEWDCYVLDDTKGRSAIRHWIAMNVESLYRPSAFRQIHVMPRMQMAWFWGDEVQAKWDLWPLVPALAPTWPPRPKPDLLTGRWVENLPAEEVERLKQIFREHGRLADPNRVDLREAIGSTARLRTSPFVAGTYALCLRKQDEKGRMLPQWTSYAIGANGEGRLLLEKWVAAHYEALKCAAIEPAQAVIPDKYFSWSDGEWHVCIPLLRWFPVAPPGSAAYSQAVKSMDKREIEELELIFRKHGKMQDLGPDCAQGVSWPGW